MDRWDIHQPRDVPNTFDDDLWKRDARETQEDYENIREEVLKYSTPRPNIAPRMNIISYFKEFSGRPFKGEEHTVYVLSDYPPCEATLVYENREKGTKVKRDIYLDSPSIEQILPHGKSLSKEAKKVNRRAKS